MKLFAVLTLSLFIAGCANTLKNLNDVSIGMTKGDVISVLGQPKNIYAEEGVEFLVFELTDAPSTGTQVGCGVGGYLTLGLMYLADGCRAKDGLYTVKLVEGKVVSYGQPQIAANSSAPPQPASQKTISHRKIRAIDAGVPVFIEKLQIDGPNSASGVGLNFRYSNFSEKTLKYIYISTIPFNAVGDQQYSDIGRESKTVLKITGPVNSGTEKRLAGWDAIWYNWSIECVAMSSIKVVYMDDSYEQYESAELKLLTEQNISIDTCSSVTN